MSTIAAISSPIGAGGIGIVRVSGKDALGIADAIFSFSHKKADTSHQTSENRADEARQKGLRQVWIPFYMNFGTFDAGEFCDKGYAVYFPEGRSYTGEDTVEFYLHGGVRIMQGALDAVGVGGDRLKVILMQLVRLTRDGEVVRMSKRTGKAITLVDLLEDIPIDAVRFLFNMREPGSQMEFDLDLAVEQSSQNPVYYCQYAHARICSIFKKLASEGIEPRDCTDEELKLLKEDEEKELIRHLASLTGEIVTSAKNCDPARITRYVVELATLFHKFYNAFRVKCDDEKLMQARLYLCACVRDTIRNILEMLKITVPESM